MLYDVKLNQAYIAIGVPREYAQKCAQNAQNDGVKAKIVEHDPDSLKVRKVAENGK